MLIALISRASGNGGELIWANGCKIAVPIRDSAPSSLSKRNRDSFPQFSVRRELHYFSVIDAIWRWE
jgi:hypothetical protein